MKNIIIKKDKKVKPLTLSKKITKEVYTVIAISGDKEDEKAGLLSLNIDFDTLEHAKKCLYEMKAEFKNYYTSLSIKVQTLTEYSI